MGGGWGKLWGEGGSGKKGKMGGREGVVVEIRGNMGMWGIVGKDSLSTLRFRCYLFIFYKLKNIILIIKLKTITN